MYILITECLLQAMIHLCNDLIYLVVIKAESISLHSTSSKIVQAANSTEVRVARMNNTRNKIERHLLGRVPINFLRDRNIYRNECNDFKKFSNILENILKKRRNFYESIVCTGFSSRLMPTALKLHFFLRRRNLESIFIK